MSAVPGQMSNLQLRIISAVILAVLVLGFTWLGGFAFRLLACILGALMLYEWFTMSRPVSGGKNQVLASAGFALLALALVLYFPAPYAFLVLGVGVAATIADAALTKRSYWAAGGLAYAGLSAISLAFLRDSDHPGLIAILFLFAVVWATDILAYFVGRSVGGPKLAPSISPGKTQSGAAGGAVGGVVAGVILAAAAGLSGLGQLAVIALVLSILAQAGDLFESWVKRQHGVKDSSAIIPGHGGVMDRIDGLVAAAFALYILGTLSGGANTPAHGLFAG